MLPQLQLKDTDIVCAARHRLGIVYIMHMPVNAPAVRCFFDGLLHNQRRDDAAP